MSVRSGASGLSNFFGTSNRTVSVDDDIQLGNTRLIFVGYVIVTVLVAFSEYGVARIQLKQLVTDALVKVNKHKQQNAKRNKNLTRAKFDAAAAANRQRNRLRWDSLTKACSAMSVLVAVVIMLVPNPVVRQHNTMSMRGANRKLHLTVRYIDAGKLARGTPHNGVQDLRTLWRNNSLLWVAAHFACRSEQGQTRVCNRRSIRTTSEGQW